MKQIVAGSTGMVAGSLDMDEATLRQVRSAAFGAVSAAFGSLGRICMALDGTFRIRFVSSRLDDIVGAGAAKRLAGESVEKVLGEELFGATGPLRQALLAGEKREGWRAFLRIDGGSARLVSVTAAPLQHDAYGVCDPEAAFLLVMRPADDDAMASSGPIVAGFGVISRSLAMSRVFRLIETLQHSEATVLVTGESGVGKEVTARIIHAHSPRRNGPFVAVNAAALPGELLETELFGHVKGSFTGATRDRVGRFEAAQDGTLFLDEVGDLPLHLQVKLLRVLQDHTFERVGDNQTRQTNARIIAATHRDLRRGVAQGSFREDLYYRLRVFPIEIPALRDRREDIEPIARVLLARVGARTGRELRFAPEALRVLLEHDWPGNVRELENALEYAATVCTGQTLQPEDLPPEVRPAPRAPEAPETLAPVLPPAPPAARGERDGARGAPAPAQPSPADERTTLTAALEQHRWSRSDTARALGISRSTLWRRMRALGLEP
jgi:DNA-binding NtrC family response regulator